MTDEPTVQMNARQTTARRLIRIGGVCVLIGVAGLGMTVIGMREAFFRATDAGDEANPAMLADGISAALVWTQLGLLFFLPGVVCTFIGLWKKYVRSADDSAA